MVLEPSVHRFISLNVNMISFCVGLFALSVFCFEATAYKIQSQIDGSEAKHRAHNVAFLREYGLVMCGGSLINNQFILSAANCMVDFVDKPYELLAVPQSTVDDNDDETVSIFVQQINLHPKFNRNSFSHDLALLKTAEKIRFSNEIQPIPLPMTDFTCDDGRLTTVVGWMFLEVGF